MYLSYMNKFIIAALFVLAAILPSNSSAQGRFKPYGFVQVQSGASTVFTNVELGKRISSTSTVGLGYAAIPELGLRFNVNGWESKGGLRSVNQSYKQNYIDTDFDLLFNIVNIFAGYDSNRAFDVNLVAGIGMNYAWNGKIGRTNYSVAKENISNKWGNGLKQTSFFGTQFRMGLAADYHLCKNWALGAEVDMNTISDDFNAKCNFHNDWMLTAQLSLTYKFWAKGKTKKQAPVEPVVETVPVQPQVVHDTVYVEKIVEAPAPVAEPVVEDKPLYEVAHYAIRGTAAAQSSSVDKIVEWCKSHSDQKIVVEGYADRGTGNPRVNMYYSQQRANNFVALLKKKGVPASQIDVKAYGDTVQPFAENDLNRCVIVKVKSEK